MLRYISPGISDSEQDRLLHAAENAPDMFSQASAMQRLCKLYSFTQSSLAAHLNVSQSTVGNKIRLLSYSPQERARILEYKLTERHARALLAIRPPKRARLIDLVGKMHFNVRQTEELVEKQKSDANAASMQLESECSSVDSFFEKVISDAQSLHEDHTSISCITEHGDGWQRITVTVKENGFT